MGMTHARAKELAEEGAAIATELKAVYWRMKEFLKANDAASVPWNNETKPAYLNEDTAGNIDGLLFSRQQLSNAIGSMNNVRMTFDGEAVTPADYLINIELIAKVNS